MSVKNQFARPRKGHIHGLYTFAYYVLTPIMKSLTKLEWDGAENLPKSGGFIVAPNHVSEFDPVAMGYFLGINGYEIKFLAKDSLFKIPLLGPFLTKWGMIPVARESGGGNSLIAAHSALENGAMMGIYYEGTITLDPAFWPMKGKTGLARLAMDTRVPVIPIVQWGAQDVMDREVLPKLCGRRRKLYYRVLPPLDYSDIEGDSSNHEGVRELTHRLTEALMKGSAELRGQKAPEEAWDAKSVGVPTKKEMPAFSKWRKSLARATGRQDILAADPALRD